MKILNVKSNKDYCKEIVTTISGRIRRQLSVMDVSGKTWSEKRKDIHDFFIKVYGDIPNGVSFARRKTKDLKNNPDGLRIFVLCSWIKRNRFFDKDGIFHMGSVLQAINKQIEGKTNKKILKEEITNE